MNLDRPGGEGWSLSWLPEMGCLTPLEVACENNDYKIAKLLIEKGADASLIRDGYFSPVYLCLETYHPDDLEMLKLLIENGADPSGIEDEEDILNHSLLNVAWMDTSKTSSDNYRKYDEAKAKDILEIYQYLEEKISNADSVVSDLFETPLMFATVKQNILLMEHLMENSPECVDKCSLSGENALFYLLPEEGAYDKQWKKETLDLLCKYSIDMNKRNSKGYTACRYAQEEGDDFLANLLKERME